MVIRWAVNLSMLLKEYSYLDRFQAAADLGFAAVETWWPPPDVRPEDVIRARERAGVAVVLLNAYAGDLAAGERGFLGNPERVDELMNSARQAFDLAQALGCPRVHVLGGNRIATLTREEQLAVAVQTHQALCLEASQRGLTLTLEPQNPRDTPYYLFHTSADAIAHIQQVNHPTLRLQYDVYHMQIAEGDITTRLRALLPLIAHIQIADVPQRLHPGTGELNYAFIFNVLEQIGYAGYVGLEYRAEPQSTLEALRWLPRDWRNTCQAEMLKDTLHRLG
ncbi:TIM barrel protein [Aggregatilineales bacterium SYSU G02658]